MVVKCNRTQSRVQTMDDLGKAVLFNIGPGVPETVSFTASIFRVGVNYKFDWGNPAAVARY